MWISDYKTNREYLACSPRGKFYCYNNIEIEPIPGQPCIITIRKGMEVGRKPAHKFEQLKWKVKIRQGLLVEEWFIKADGSLSNLNHIEFIAKNEGIIISETGYYFCFPSCIKYEEKDIPGIIRDILRVNNRLKNDDIEIISIKKIKNKINT